MDIENKIELLALISDKKANCNTMEIENEEELFFD